MFSFKNTLFLKSTRWTNTYLHPLLSWQISVSQHTFELCCITVHIWVFLFHSIFFTQWISLQLLLLLQEGVALLCLCEHFGLSSWAKGNICSKWQSRKETKLLPFISTTEYSSAISPEEKLNKHRRLLGVFSFCLLFVLFCLLCLSNISLVKRKLKK